MWEKVEVLKYHPNLTSHRAEVLVIILGNPTTVPGASEQFSIDFDVTIVRRLECHNEP